jgi:hypothetical protein
METAPARETALGLDRFPWWQLDKQTLVFPSTPSPRVFTAIPLHTLQ